MWRGTGSPPRRHSGVQAAQGPQTTQVQVAPQSRPKLCSASGARRVPQGCTCCQSVSHCHTPSTELTTYTQILRWSYFKCAAGFSASSKAYASSSFFWNVVVLQDGLLLLSLLPIFLLAQILMRADRVMSDFPRLHTQRCGRCQNSRYRYGQRRGVPLRS